MNKLNINQNETDFNLWMELYKKELGNSKKQSIITSIVFFIVFNVFNINYLQAAESGLIVSEQHSGQCVNISGGSLNDDKQVIQWPCTSTANEQFSFLPVNGAYQIRAKHSGKCIGVKNASIAQGASVVQMTCAPKEHMLWRVEGFGSNQKIRVSHTNMCLNIQNASRSQGEKLIQWPCVGATNEKWRIDVELNNAQTNNSRWDGPYPMPLVASAAANLPDGKILTWSAYSKMTFGGSRGKTYTSIFDPATGQSSEGLISNTEHDMFCPGTALLADGRVMVTGGSNNQQTSIYNPTNDTWAKGPKMNLGRGYHAMTTLNDGSVFSLGGSWSGGRGNKDGEVWNETTGWTTKPLIQASLFVTNDEKGVLRADNHMWLFTAPNGLVFHAGPSRQMNWINTDGDGEVNTSIVRSDDKDAMNGNAVMYDIGKILTIGGAPHYSDSNASNRAYTIDINGGQGNVSVKKVGNMTFARAFSHSIVLPSGEVVVIGGHKRAIPFSDNNSVFATEIWSSETENFTTLGSMSVPRNYHSVALLMKDGRVFVAGGGLCGNCATNHPDAEILTPPYLLNTDGLPAERPVIEELPSSAKPGDNLIVTMDTTSVHSFALVRTSATTHSVNNDQRRIPLEAIKLSERDYQLSIPANRSVVIPGNYFLFAMNQKGVPSIAKILNIKVLNEPIEPSIPPVCEMGADPQTINQGEGTAIWWWSQSSLSGNVTNIGNITVPSSYEWLYPTETTTYKMTALGENNTYATCETTVIVQPNIQSAVCALGADPQIINSGEGTAVWWWTVNAASATVTNIGAAELPSNYKWIYPTETTKYTINVAGNDGANISCETTVTVR